MFKHVILQKSVVLIYSLTFKENDVFFQIVMLRPLQAI